MEEEINLIDYIKVLFKRKKVILITFLIALLIGIIFGVFGSVKRNYNEFFVLIKIGKIGDFIPETPIELQRKIEQHSYNKLLKEKLKLSDDPSIEAQIFPETSLVLIKTKTKNSEGKKILKELVDIILIKHKEKTDKMKNFLKKRIEYEEQKIATILKNIAEERDIFPYQYLYTDYLSKIDQMKYDLDIAEDTEVITSYSEQINIISKSAINVIVAGILGIFLGVFLAFLQEFWEKNKKILRGN